MTFLFLGLDALDYKLVEEYRFLEDASIPVSFTRLEQDLPEVISEQGSRPDPTGHWTFYVWPAIAVGQVLTPEMRQEHPHRNEVEYPLRWKYLKHAPRMLSRYLKGRIQRRPRYKSFAWDDFENVKVINYPLHLPEYCENCNLIRDDAISRNYGPVEPRLLLAEINDAIRKNYDAVFAVTRLVDCTCHGATQPANWDADSYDEWLGQLIHRRFDDFHQGGMSFGDALAEDQVDVSAEQEMDAAAIQEAVLEQVRTAYEEMEHLLEGINWDGVSDHVIVSDHGFNKLGAGSVTAHSRDAVLSCSFGHWQYMSGFIRNWRTAYQRHLDIQEKQREQVQAEASARLEQLPQPVNIDHSQEAPDNEFKELDEDEEVKQRMEELGYL